MITIDNNPVFALDIGTRSVIGLIMEKHNDEFRVIASEVAEHRHRAMMDGQIHDVEQVAKVVSAIKRKLEEKTGTQLNGVAVAAAGRALKTVKATTSRDTSLFEEITKEDVLSLELEAVQIAQSQLLDGQIENIRYHCVGYTVVHYHLNDQRIGNLIGHQGEQISVEILATFLPRVVVDSLFSVLDKAGLEMSSLTLEPIAASQVVIPQSMRQLSVALVDIGAGTSDIAITAEGTIGAFAMVPEAGDEITEAICESYLLDFNEGDRVKRLLAESEQVAMRDILGVESVVSSTEILQQIDGKISGLAQKISEKILELAPKQVQAVLFVGGGALTPNLASKVAAHMGISPQRVAVRGRDAVSEVVGEFEVLNGPDAITPLGIAVTAHLGIGLSFRKVVVNNKSVRIFDLNEGSVADALLAAGVSMRKLIGRPGLALTVTVNGEFEVLKGHHGKPAKILINGALAALDSPVASDDQIIVETAENGEDATGIIADVVEDVAPLLLYVNDKDMTINPMVTMNEQVVEANTPLLDRAEITVYRPRTVGQALEMLGMEAFLDGTYEIKLNGTLVEPKNIVGNQDRIILTKLVTNSNLNPDSDQYIDGDIDVNSSSQEANSLNIQVNGQFLSLVKDQTDIMFVHLFNYVEISKLPPVSGATLRMLINEQPAEFTTVLKDGDVITLDWHV